MIPFECIEPYDIFFTKERYALRALESVGLRNLYYLPHHCVPDLPPPGDADRRGSRALRVARQLRRELLSLSRAPDARAGALSRSGSGARAGSARSRRRSARMVAGGPVWGRAKLAVYSGSTAVAQSPPSDERHRRGQQPRLRARGERRLPGRGPQGGAARPVHARRGGRGLPRPRRAAPQLDYYLAHPDEARAIGENAHAPRAQGAHPSPPHRGDHRGDRGALRRRS